MEIVIKWFGSEVNLDCVRVWNVSIDAFEQQLPMIGDHLHLVFPIYDISYWRGSRAYSIRSIWLFKVVKREWYFGSQVILEVKLEDNKEFFKIPEEIREKLKEMFNEDQKRLEEMWKQKDF